MVTVKPNGASEPDKIEQEIIDTFTGLPERAVAEEWSGDVIWDKNVVYPLGQLGKRLGYYVCATHCRDLHPENQGEWLWDLTWLHYSEDLKSLVSLPLILESEWSHQDEKIDDDFQKLMTARADHRVMICRSDDPNRHFDRCVEQVRKCGMTKAGDRYLFAGLDLIDNKFKFRIFVA